MPSSVWLDKPTGPVPHWLRFKLDRPALMVNVTNVRAACNNCPGGQWLPIPSAAVLIALGALERWARDRLGDDATEQDADAEISRIETEGVPRIEMHLPAAETKTGHFSIDTVSSVYFEGYQKCALDMKPALAALDAARKETP